MEVADALAGARLATTPENVRLGVVHGELSPNDVLLSWGGEVKVSDFGVAAATRAASSIRSVRTLAQRIRALAPEVARGQMGDARSDVFSLGVLLREMLVGPRFPPSMSEKEALEQARDGVVASAVFEPQLSQELRVILGRALDRDPARRFPHAGALGYELRRVALAMGVGDGRSFLRNALPRVFASSMVDDDEITDEVRFGARPSGVVDRFVRLREGELTDRESGTIRRALRFVAEHPDDEEGVTVLALGDDDD
jgi:serine/threonine-protein kinase